MSISLKRANFIRGPAYIISLLVKRRRERRGFAAQDRLFLFSHYKHAILVAIDKKNPRGFRGSARIADERPITRSIAMPRRLPSINRRTACAEEILRTPISFPRVLPSLLITFLFLYILPRGYVILAVIAVAIRHHRPHRLSDHPSQSLPLSPFLSLPGYLSLQSHSLTLSFARSLARSVSFAFGIFVVFFFLFMQHIMRLGSIS